MKYPFKLEEYPDSQFDVDVNIWTGKAKVFKDGVQLTRLIKEKDKPFEVTNRLRDSTLIYVKPTFPDPAPRITVNGKKVEFVPQLNWYEYILAGVPVVLVFTGGLIGGVIAAGACILNFQIIRGDRPKPIKYSMVIGVSVLSILLALFLSFIFLKEWENKGQ